MLAAGCNIMHVLLTWKLSEKSEFCIEASKKYVTELEYDDAEPLRNRKDDLCAIHVDKGYQDASVLFSVMQLIRVSICSVLSSVGLICSQKRSLHLAIVENYFACMKSLWTILPQNFIRKKKI